MEAFDVELDGIEDEESSRHDHGDMPPVAGEGKCRSGQWKASRCVRENDSVHPISRDGFVLESKEIFSSRNDSGLNVYERY